MKFEVGQKLWLVPVRWSRIGKAGDDGKEVTVISVGRKWIGLDNGKRVDAKTLKVEMRGYSDTDRCYPSRENYRHEYELNQEWEWLRHMIPISRPPGITLDSIQLIASVLQLEPRKKTA